MMAITIKQQWEKAVELLDLNDVSKIQYIEMRKAFYSGVSSALLESRDMAGKVVEGKSISDEDGAEILQSWLIECERFWVEEVGSYKREKKGN